MEFCVVPYADTGAGFSTREDTFIISGAMKWGGSQSTAGFRSYRTEKRYRAMIFKSEN